MDHHAFFRRGEEEFYREFGSDTRHFDPRPCDYIALRRKETSEITIDQGTLNVDEVLRFISKDRIPNTTNELRIIFTPPRINWTETFASPLPFQVSLFRDVMSHFEFHKTCFESRNLQDAARVTVGSVNSFFFSCWRHGAGNNMKIFISTNAQTRITVGFVHSGLLEELNYVRERLQDPLLHSLMVHPLLLLVFVAEHLVASEASMVRSCYYDAVKRLPPRTFYWPDAKDEDVVQDTQNAHYLQHEIAYFSLCLGTLRASLNALIEWSKDCDSTSSEQEKNQVTEAEAIISHRWVNLLSRVDDCERLLKTTKEYNEVERQYRHVKIAEAANQLNLRIAAQSRDIALESRRDATAMKAIAVLTMIFLPGTFFSTFFAMPFFDWNAPTYSSVLNSQFWIYTVFTIPTTLCVLLAWRIWYQLEEWRDWDSRRGRSPFFADLYEWLKSGRPKVSREREVDLNERPRNSNEGVELQGDGRDFRNACMRW